MNTDSNSFQKIWKKVDIGNYLYFGDDLISIDYVISFLEKKKIQAKKENFLNVEAWVYFDDSDKRLYITGYRIETHEEWISRLTCILKRHKYEVEKATQEYTYYISKDFNDKIKEIETLINLTKI